MIDLEPEMKRLRKTVRESSESEIELAFEGNLNDECQCMSLSFSFCHSNFSI